MCLFVYYLFIWQFVVLTFAQYTCSLYLNTNASPPANSTLCNEEWIPCNTLSRTLTDATKWFEENPIIEIPCVVCILPGTFSGTENTNVVIDIPKDRELIFQAVQSDTVTFSGDLSYQIAVILSGNIKWYGIRFLQGVSRNSGGGCLELQSSDGSLGLYNCTFSQCNTNGHGGAVGALGEIWIDNCEFLDCAANFGGAVYVNSSSGNITNSVFISNTGNYGGAIAIQSAINIIINEVFAIDNRVEKSGGALWCVNTTSLEILSSLYTDNLAKSNGGALYISNITYFKLDKSVFFRQQAILGGVLYLKLYTIGQILVNSSTFTDNTADSGGAIALEGKSNNTGTVILSNLQINLNEVKDYGGALWISGIDLKLENINISQNIAFQGGGIYCMGEIYYDPSNFQNIVFINNTANSCVDSQLGGTCPGFFDLCPLYEATQSCDLCDGNNCYFEGNLMHCLSDPSQGCLCHPIPNPINPQAGPSTISGAVVGLGIFLGLVTIVAVGAVIKIFVKPRKIEYDIVPEEEE